MSLVDLEINLPLIFFFFCLHHLYIGMVAGGTNVAQNFGQNFTYFYLFKGSFRLPRGHIQEDGFYWWWWELPGSAWGRGTAQGSYSRLLHVRYALEPLCSAWHPGENSFIFAYSVEASSFSYARLILAGNVIWWSTEFIL